MFLIAERLRNSPKWLLRLTQLSLEKLELIEMRGYVGEIIIAIAVVTSAASVSRVANRADTVS